MKSVYVCINCKYPGPYEDLEVFPVLGKYAGHRKPLEQVRPMRSSCEGKQVEQKSIKFFLQISFSEKNVCQLKN